MGSLQYAGSHLHTPLFVVLGHQGCGAVHAALDTKLNGTQHKSRIQILVNAIALGLSAIDTRLPAEAQLEQAVEHNIRWSMQQLLATPEGKVAVEEGRARILGAVYEITSGRVRFFD